MSHWKIGDIAKCIRCLDSVCYIRLREDTKRDPMGLKQWYAIILKRYNQNWNTTTRCTVTENYLMDLITEELLEL